MGYPVPKCAPARCLAGMMVSYVGESQYQDVPVLDLGGGPHVPGPGTDVRHRGAPWGDPHARHRCHGSYSLSAGK